MSRSESWKAWTAIILILLVSGFIAAVWPYLPGLSGGSSEVIPVEPETIIITVPAIPGVFDGTVIELGSFQAFAILALVVIVSVVVVGVIIGVINYLISRLVTNTVSSDKYQERNAALQQHEDQKNKDRREGREAAAAQQNDYSRWSVIATCLAILMFAAFLGYLVASTLFPTGQIMEQDQIVNMTRVIVVAFLLITLFILLLLMNPKRLAAINESDYSGIPWETITVILLGVLVLGLGIGFVIFLNLPL
ncbi:MAG: hypothetical protein R3293_18600 [Candidatus Promineifilaceae bacterium]|nr:hypothetical protein [Candidatus Promineifilaceae bacterium]